jgi:hypothetical protein
MTDLNVKERKHSSANGQYIIQKIAERSKILIKLYSCTAHGPLEVEEI